MTNSVAILREQARNLTAIGGGGNVFAEIADELEQLQNKLTETNMIKHNEMVAVLAKDGATILEEMDPAQMHLTHMAIGVAGEAGELLDAVKKNSIYQKPIDRVNVVEELGDIEFYLEGLRQGLAITREETIESNIAKLGKRYEGFEFTNEAAQLRADKAPGE